jgi:hypothetical protein
MEKRRRDAAGPAAETAAFRNAVWILESRLRAPRADFANTR